MQIENKILFLDDCLDNLLENKRKVRMNTELIKILNDLNDTLKTKISSTLKIEIFLLLYKFYTQLMIVKKNSI